jgi:hypothetical protein
MGWAPNVDIALVATAVDPPLSQRDLALIRNLLDFTPHVAVLLTKFDMLSQAGQKEVLDFVKTQLARNVETAIEVYPYSTRAGYERLRSTFTAEFVDRFRARIADERAGIADRKIATLIRESGDYMRLILKAAEMIEVEKSELHERARRERSTLADAKLELSLIARHAMAGGRTTVEAVLSTEEATLGEEVRHALADAAPAFPTGFARLTEVFGQWLDTALSSRLEMLSREKKGEFLEPLADVQRQYARILQRTSVTACPSR